MGGYSNQQFICFATHCAEDESAAHNFATYALLCAMGVVELRRMIHVKYIYKQIDDKLHQIDVRFLA